MKIETVFVTVILLFCGTVPPSWSATYYVSTTGNDSTGDGSSDNPWRNPQKCVAAGTPLVAGDTCIVRTGTYTDLDGDGIVVRTNTGSPSGTATNPITIRSETRWGAVISIVNAPGGATGNHGFRISFPYYVIDGFDVDGAPVTVEEASHGITFAAGAYGGVARNNKIHHIGRNTCTNNPNWVNVGISIGTGVNDILMEENVIYSVGKRRQGELGCVSSQYQRDHGIYGSGSNHTIRRNVIYDTDRGYPIHYFSTNCTTVTSNLLIEHNTLSGAAPPGAGGNVNGAPQGQIRLACTVNNATIRNNVSHGVSGAAHGFMNAQPGTHTNVTVTGTLTDGLINVWGASLNNVTYTNNVAGSSSLNLVNPAANDFRLLPTSAAIDTGLSAGQAFCGAAPDKGRYEVCAPQSASINTVNIDLTMAGIYFPYTPGGTTGWSVSCSPSCGTLSIANVSVLSNSVLRVEVSGFSGGFCLNTQTITVSYNSSTGTLLDAVGQPVYSFTSFPVTNNCSGSAAPAFPGTPHILYELDGNANDSSGGARHGTQSGGSFVAAKHGQGLQGTLGSAVSVTAPYGSGINPSTQSLTIAFGYFVPAGQTVSDITVFGSSLGTNQRFYVQAKSGTWQIGVQATAVSAATPSDLPVTEGWNHLCLRVDSGADVMTLHKNGVAATSGRGLQSYTSYTLASNIAFGLPSGFAASGAGGGIWDRAVMYTSLESCSSIYDNWEPPASSTTSGYAQVAYKWERVYANNGVPATIGSTNTPIDVVEAGAVALVVQIDRTESNGEPVSIVPRYSYNGGGYNNVLPVGLGADGIGLWGSSTDAGLNNGVATCCISGALTPNHGNTITVAPIERAVTLNQNHSIVYRYIIRVGPTGQTWSIRLYNANGTPLTSYGQTPTLTTIPGQASDGP